MQFFPFEMVGSLEMDENIEMAVQWFGEVMDAFDSGVLKGVTGEE